MSPPCSTATRLAPTPLRALNFQPLDISLLLGDNLNMFKTENMIMNHPHSSQHDNFLGAVGLLVVGAFAVAFMGSVAGFVAIVVLIGVLWTRTQWARIVTLVIVAYVGVVSLLVSLLARGESSFAGFLATLIAAAIFWLLLRPGMSEYFGSSSSAAPAQVVRVAPRPGALPHLQQQPTAASATPPAEVAVGPGTASGSTQEQWARLQQQLRAEQAKEQREEKAAATAVSSQRIGSRMWLIVALFAFSFASSAAGEIGRLAIILVVPGFIAAMLRWIDTRAFALGVLALSCGLLVWPERNLLTSSIRAVLQHH